MTSFIKQAGWGKKLSYVIVFSRYGIADVSQRYSTNAKATVERQNIIVSPQWVQQQCRAVTNHLRSGLSRQEILDLEARDAREQSELCEASETKDEESLPGREKQNQES